MRKNNLDRYYLVSFHTPDYIANLWFKLSMGAFPSNQWLKEQAKIKFNVVNPIILNIYEFKSKEDYEDFIKTN